MSDGKRVRLEAVRLGGRWLTSVQAIERFIDRQTPNLDADSPPAPPTQHQRECAAERAGKVLEKAHHF
jgi:hypothetical protein